MQRRRRVLAIVATAAIAVLAATGIVTAWRVTEVLGAVTTQGQPLAGAVVRVKATGYETRSDQNGQFVLVGFPSRFGVPVTAWVNGFYVGGAVAWPWKRSVSISLQPYQTTDNPAYSWIAPAVEDRSSVSSFLVRAGLAVTARLSFNRLFLPLSSKVKLGCADCHGMTIYKEYAASAHAQGTRNPRFLSMYNGTDVQGNKSPPTRYGFHRDYGRFPLRPEPKQPWYGPGFKLDFPDQAGNCAACHMPGEAADAPYDSDINGIPATAVQGTHCDFCHKVANVRLDPSTGLPYENMPGVLSMELRRPAGEPQMFFGPFDDVDVGPDTFSPLQNESRFCAPCHNASFWGTPIYQSYAEWLASPYPQEGKTCQSCHMKPDGVTTNFAPGRGGLERDANTVFTHKFPGAGDTDLLQNTARLEVWARLVEDRVLVEVRVTNENAGHHLPTDHPARNVLLVISARDVRGRELEYLAGPVIPGWGGVGVEPGDLGGRPGKGYAKVLEELWTEISPTAAYWRQTVVREDTRIPAKGIDAASFEFAAPEPGPVTVDVALIFRRAFKELATLKKWDLDDIEMAHQVVKLP